MGNHPSKNATTKSAMGPVTNVGTLMPANVITMMPVSVHVLRRSAARMPAPMPKMSSKTMAMTPSSSVRGMRWPMTAATSSRCV
jgi:hypothetical protein